MSPDIDFSNQRVAYEDEAVKEALTKILSNKYKRDVRITGFVREDLANSHRCVVSRLYLQLDSCDETTVIVKQFNPDWLDRWYVSGEDFIVAQEALGRILLGKRLAPEFYGTVRDVEKRRYWLFMEDLGENLVRGRKDWENEEMKHCLGFVEKLAKMHLLFADNEKELRALRALQLPPCPRAAWRGMYKFAIESAPDNIEKIVQTGKFPWLNEMATDFAAILEPCLPIVDSIVMPHLFFSFTHGDKSPVENMVISREGEEPIYYFIDWDDFGLAPVLDDLADFLGYGRGETRGETEELTLVSRYWECVQGSPLVPKDLGECLMMYKYSKLMNYIHSVHWHLERIIQEQFRDDSLVIFREGKIRRRLPVAIKLAKELKIM